MNLKDVMVHDAPICERCGNFKYLCMCMYQVPAIDVQTNVDRNQIMGIAMNDAKAGDIITLACSGCI